MDNTQPTTKSQDAPSGRQGILLVLSSPSGAGKSTMARALLADDPAFQMSVSATTRPARPGETHGKDYLFVDPNEFERMVADNELLEHATVFGNRYGSPAAPVAAAIAAGRDVLFDVDWQGGQQLRESTLRDCLVTIFLLPPSIAALEARLRSRAQDSEEVIAGRMAKTWSELSHWREYDYVLINDDQATCYSQIGTIVAAERLRRTRQTGMTAKIEALSREFDAIQAKTGEA